MKKKKKKIKSKFKIGQMSTRLFMTDYKMNLADLIYSMCRDHKEKRQVGDIYFEKIYLYRYRTYNITLTYSIKD